MSQIFPTNVSNQPLKQINQYVVLSPVCCVALKVAHTPSYLNQHHIHSCLSSGAEAVPPPVSLVHAASTC